MIRLDSFRLVNVRANCDSMVYPDVTVHLHGENTLIDTKNGGGKTLAAQMLFQTVLPNSYFDENKTVKTLFIGTPPKTTMHTVASFLPNESAEYGSLCLGFAVSRSQDVSRELNVLNYVVEGDDLDRYGLGVESLRLKTEDGGVSIPELKRLLSEGLQASNGSCRVTTFENRPEDYVQYLKRFDINAQVYRFIMSINQTENYIQQYFEKHCSTQQGLLTEFIIPNTVWALDERRSALKGNAESDVSILAQSLLEKSKSLSELRTMESEIGEYRKIIALIDSFLYTLKSRRGSFTRYERLLKEYSKQYADYLSDVERSKASLAENSASVAEVESSLAALDESIEYLTTRRYECEVLDVQERLKSSEEYYTQCQADTQRLRDTLDRMLATNSVVEYRSVQSRLRLLESAQTSPSDGSLASYANTVYSISNLQIRKTQYEMDYVRGKVSELNASLYECMQSLGRLDHLTTLAQDDVRNWSEELNDQLVSIERLQNELEGYERYGDSLLESEELFATVDTVKELEKRLDALKARQNSLSLETSVANHSIETLEGSIERYSEVVRLDLARKQSYEDEVAQLKRELGVEEFEFENRYDELKARQVEINVETSRLDAEVHACKEEISTMKQYGILREQSRYDALERLRAELESACFGSEVLQSIDDIKLLERFPALAEVVLVSDKDYASIKGGKELFPEGVLKENFVIMPYNTIRNIDKLTFSEMFYLTRGASYYTSMMDVDARVEECNQKILSHRYQMERLSSEYDAIQSLCNRVVTHVSTYSFETVQDTNARLERNSQTLDSLKSQLSECRRSLEEGTSALEECSAEVARLEGEVSKAQAKKALLEELIGLVSESRRRQVSISNERKKLETYAAKVNDLNVRIASIQAKTATFQSDFEYQKATVSVYRSYVAEVQDYVDDAYEPIDSKDVELLVQRFRALKGGLGVGSVDEVKPVLNAVLESIKARSVFLDVDFDAVDGSNEVLVPFDRATVDACRADLKEAEELLRRQSSFMVSQNATLETYVDRFNARLNAEDSQYDDYRKYSSGEVETLLERLKSERESLSERLKSLNATRTSLEAQYHDSHLQCELYRYFCLEKRLDLDLPSDGSKRIPFERMDERYGDALNEYRSALDEVNASIKKLSTGVDHLNVSEQIKYTIKNNAITKRDYGEVATFSDRLRHLKSQAEAMILNLQTSVDNLGRIDEDVSEQLYRVLSEILDEVSAIPKVSKCRFGDGYKETFKINLYTGGRGCRLPEERVRSSIKKYVSELARDISTKGYDKSQIVELLSIDKTIHFGVDMNRLNVQILKVDQEKPTYQNWENVIASTGQEYIMYVMFTVTMVKYFNDVMGNGSKSPLFIFLDNPFASASDVQLWQPVRKFLDKNDTQLLCLSHNVPAVGQILFERQTILEQSKDSDGRLVNSVRNEKSELRENTQLSLFEHLEIV